MLIYNNSLEEWASIPIPNPIYVFGIKLMAMICSNDNNTDSLNELKSKYDELKIYLETRNG